MKRCKNCQGVLTNLYAALCDTCSAGSGATRQEYENQRRKAPEIHALISISEQELARMQHETRRDEASAASSLRRLQKLHDALDAADHGWKFLWIESSRRREVNSQYGELDAAIARDQAKIERLRQVKKNIASQIRKLSA